MSALDRRKALHLVEDVSLAGNGGVSAPDFLERVCGVVAEGLGFDYVAAARFHPEPAEVWEVAAAGSSSTDRTERQALTDTPLLARALETEDLVHVSAGDFGDVTSAFALPLISNERCLGFLSGNRRSIVGPDGGEADALTTLGIVVSTLLDNALVREEAQQLDTLKSEFIALAAHELRNPSASIYGICLTLDERGEAMAEPERLALREALRQQTERMRHLVEQLLDLSRFDLVAIPVSPQFLRLRPQIEELVRALADTPAKAVTIAVPADLEARVDPIALDRMVSNLVANALRYGEPPVTVSAARRDTHLRLTVEDRGKGVPREFVPRLFDRFSRSPESRGRTDGSGLGLAIAQAYARAQGGDIVYESAVPQGARFEVVIPLRGADGTET